MITNKKILIKVKTIFKATHNWENCDIEQVQFLKYPHHHEFEITVKMLIGHQDRDVEFICYQRWLDKFLQDSYPDHDLGSSSCEMLADKIAYETINHWKVKEVEVEVNEDGHYGGIVQIFEV